MHAPDASGSLAEEYFANDPMWMRVIAHALEANILGSRKIRSQSVHDLSSIDVKDDPRLTSIVQKLLKKDPSVITAIEELSLEEEGANKFERVFHAVSVSELSTDYLEDSDEHQYSKVLASKVLKSAGVCNYLVTRALNPSGGFKEAPEDYSSVMSILEKMSGQEAAKSDLAKLLTDGFIGKKTPSWLEVEVASDVRANVGMLTRKFTRVLSMEVNASSPIESKITLFFVPEYEWSKEATRQNKSTKSKIAAIKQSLTGVLGRVYRSDEPFNNRYALSNVKNSRVVAISGVCSFREDKFVCIGENFERQNKTFTN